MQPSMPTFSRASFINTGGLTLHSLVKEWHCCSNKTALLAMLPWQKKNYVLLQ